MIDAGDGSAAPPSPPAPPAPGLSPEEVAALRQQVALLQAQLQQMQQRREDG